MLWFNLIGKVGICTPRDVNQLTAVERLLQAAVPHPSLTEPEKGKSLTYAPITYIIFLRDTKK